jgi:serine/threonine protein phosphatase PrpC/ribosomal protein L40E
MKICPKCEAENRPEAAFCARCGTILLAQPARTKPSPATPPATVPARAEPVLVEAVASQITASELSLSEPPKAELVGLLEVEPVFTTRPEGSVFGGRFQYLGLVDEAKHHNLYSVTEISQPPAPSSHRCSNPDCRTIHIPAGDEAEIYCTYCGHPLEMEPPILLLQETETDQSGNCKNVIEIHLVHPNIHPPIAAFQEEMPEGMRYCTVMPDSQELPGQPELSQALEWGRQLASGLDYLQSQGIVVGEELDLASFGLVDGKAVWRKFNNTRILPMLADREKINNVRLLALCLYTWITGRATYTSDPSVHPRINRLFHRALVGEGFTSGVELAEQIEQALDSIRSPFNLAYHVGRRTHPGIKRVVNEDSLLCYTVNSVKEGISKPMGIFAIADGMGGHANGDVASSLAIQSITEKTSADMLSLYNRTDEEITSWLNHTIQKANLALFEDRTKANSDMGSTLVCTLMLGNKAYLTHLGDSRMYLLREGDMQQLTTDHSMVQQLVSIGKISPEDARNHPQRNVIYRSLGEKPQVEMDIYTQTLKPGDKLLLCSDGLTGMLNDPKIQILIHEAPSPQTACDYLVDAANLDGGEDNISVILVEVILT